MFAIKIWDKVQLEAGLASAKNQKEYQCIRQKAIGVAQSLVLTELGWVLKVMAKLDTENTNRVHFFFSFFFLPPTLREGGNLGSTQMYQ
jgi:hypothetical protein